MKNLDASLGFIRFDMPSRLSPTTRQQNQRDYFYSRRGRLIFLFLIAHSLGHYLSLPHQIDDVKSVGRSDCIYHRFYFERDYLVSATCKLD